MAHYINHVFPGGTQEQYEAVMIALNGALGVLPEGQIFHVAGAVPGGWQVTAVQESKESWDRFVAAKFLPIMRRGVEGGFTAPPTETAFEITHFYR